MPVCVSCQNLDGNITIAELGPAMRVVGMEPTEVRGRPDSPWVPGDACVVCLLLTNVCARPLQAELRIAATHVDKLGTGNVAFADFLALMAKRVADSESPAACVNAFKVCE